MRRFSLFQNRRSQPRAGFGLIESSIAVLLTGLLMLAALRSVGASKRREAGTGDLVRGQQIAADLMNEILRQAYQEPTDLPLFGLEPNESTGNRSLFDDVDDYINWSSSPPKDRSGTAIPGFTGWTQAVSVIWANPSTLGTTTNSDTGLKKITVTISKSGKTVTQIVGYRCVSWVDTIPTPSDPLGNHPPVAVATGLPLSGKASVVRTFLAYSSSDQDSDAMTYVWNFGDGTTGSGPAVIHQYSAIGTYACTLTVYDGRGGVGVVALTVSVVP